MHLLHLLLMALKRSSAQYLRIVVVHELHLFTVICWQSSDQVPLPLLDGLLGRS